MNKEELSSKLWDVHTPNHNSEAVPTVYLVFNKNNNHITFVKEDSDMREAVQLDKSFVRLLCKGGRVYIYIDSKDVRLMQEVTDYYTLERLIQLSDSGCGAAYDDKYLAALRQCLKHTKTYKCFAQNEIEDKISVLPETVVQMSAYIFGVKSLDYSCSLNAFVGYSQEQSEDAVMIVPDKDTWTYSKYITAEGLVLYVLRDNRVPEVLHLVRLPQFIRDCVFGELLQSCLIHADLSEDFMCVVKSTKDTPVTAVTVSD